MPVRVEDSYNRMNGGEKFGEEDCSDLEVVTWREARLKQVFCCRVGDETGGLVL